MGSQLTGPAEFGALRLRLLDDPIGLEIADESTRERLKLAWSRCEDRSGIVDPHHSITAEPRDDDDTIAATLLTRAIEAAAPRRLIFRAAGLSRGKAVVAVLPADPSARSVPVHILDQPGFGYVTHEVLAAGADGEILSCPHPLPTSGGDLSDSHLISPDEMGLGRCEDSLRLAAVVFVNLDDSAGAPSISRVERVAAMLELIPRTSYLTRRRRPLQQLSDLLDTCAGVFHVTCRTAEDLGGVLQRLLEQERHEPEPVERLSGDGSRTWAMKDGRVRRAPWRDAIVVDDEALFLIDRTPARVSGIGLTIWEHAHDAPTLDQLTERVVAEFGPHPDAARLVHDAVEAMTEAGVLGFGRPQTLDDYLAACREVAAAEMLNGCCDQPAS